MIQNLQFQLCSCDISIFNLGCRYERLENRVVDEGTQLAKYSGKSQKECEEFCDSLPHCHSFGYKDENGGKCWLYDKVLNGDENLTSSYNIYTVFKKCGKFM